MALNVSNVLMLLLQQMTRKQLVHITTLNMNHIQGVKKLIACQELSYISVQINI